jgi:hypothetical protein
MLPMMILLCVGIAYTWEGFKKKSKKSFIVSIIGFVLMFALFPFNEAAFEQENKKHDAMVSNILTKYNREALEVEGWDFPHLRDVEYVGKGGKHESGTYFNLTYGDKSTAKVKFYFNDKTGEPRPRCTCDVKQNSDLLMIAGEDYNYDGWRSKIVKP